MLAVDIGGSSLRHGIAAAASTAPHPVNTAPSMPAPQVRIYGSGTSGCYTDNEYRAAAAHGHPMTIRRKIYALAGALLALFGLVVGGLSLLQWHNSGHLENIVRYQLQITRLLSDLDIATFE